MPTLVLVSHRECGFSIELAPLRVALLDVAGRFFSSFLLRDAYPSHLLAKDGQSSFRTRLDWTMKQRETVRFPPSGPLFHSQLA